MPFLAVLGHANIDVQLELQNIPLPGASSPVQDRRTVYGGTAANIARQAAGLGVPTRLWARVGADFPSDWRAGLEADGVDLSFMDVDATNRTPTCYILTDADGQQSYCMDQGAMGAMVQHPPTAALLEGLSWLHIGTGDPTAYMEIAQLAKAAGVKIAFDPGQELRFMYTSATFELLLDVADVVFLNELELSLALEYLRYGDPVQLLDHVGTVVVTRGAEGASLYQAGKKPVHQPALPAAAVDPTGAGDALRAGWYSGLADGLDAPMALARGQAAGAIIVTHLGPQSHTLRLPEIADA